MSDNQKKTNMFGSGDVHSEKEPTLFGIRGGWLSMESNARSAGENAVRKSTRSSVGFTPGPHNNIS